MPNATDEIIQWHNSIKELVVKYVFPSLAESSEMLISNKEFFESYKKQVEILLKSFNSAKGKEEKSELQQKIYDKLYSFNENFIGDPDFDSLSIASCDHSVLEKHTLGFLDANIADLNKSIGNNNSLCSKYNIAVKSLSSSVAEIIRMYESPEPFDEKKFQILIGSMKEQYSYLKASPIVEFPEFPKMIIERLSPKPKPIAPTPPLGSITNVNVPPPQSLLERPIVASAPIAYRSPIEIWETLSRTPTPTPLDSPRIERTHSTPQFGHNSNSRFIELRSPSAPTLMPPPGFGP